MKRRIDHELTLQLEGKSLYWKSVLRRMVTAAKALTSRGLALRDDMMNILAVFIMGILRCY